MQDLSVQISRILPIVERLCNFLTPLIGSSNDWAALERYCRRFCRLILCRQGQRLRYCLFADAFTPSLDSISITSSSLVVILVFLLRMIAS